MATKKNTDKKTVEKKKNAFDSLLKTAFNTKPKPKEKKVNSSPKK